MEDQHLILEQRKDQRLWVEILLGASVPKWEIPKSNYFRYGKDIVYTHTKV